MSRFRLDRLPPRIANLAASAGGWALRRQRYGGDLETRVAEVLARESWSHGEWSNWQRSQLADLLGAANQRVPHYQALDLDTRSLDELSSWPVLVKATVGEDAASLLSQPRDRRLIRLHTSGSTATPLRLWRDREAERAWYALYEARVLRWNGLRQGDPWAIFGGRLVAPAGRSRPPFWVENRSLNQLYCSAYHLGEKTVTAYAQALQRFRPRFVVGYPSALAVLAQLSIDLSTELPQVRAVISNGEPLTAEQRATIGTAFQAPVRNTYGMTEICAAASECEHGVMHLWPEVGVVEVLELDSDRPAAPGTPGRLICTGLLNRAMPLVRYDVGDIGVVSEPAEPCLCGRSLPVLEQLEGRLDDLIVTPSGRRVGRLDTAFKGDLPVREAQIVQTHPDRLLVRVVAAAGYDEASSRQLVQALTDRLGPMQLEVEQVEKLERGPAGKLRTVVSRVE